MNLYLLLLPNGNILSVPNTALVYARCQAEELGHPSDLPVLEILPIGKIAEINTLSSRKEESPVLQHGA